MDVNPHLYKKEIDNYKYAVGELIKVFLTLNFRDAAAASGSTYDEKNNRLSLVYFGKELSIDCATGSVSPMDDSFYLSGEGITIMNYFNRYPKYAGVPLTGQLVSLMEVPGGGAQFFPAFKNLALRPLAEAFGDDASRLYKAAEVLGGERSNFGQAAITLRAFPYFPVTLVVWEGDDEFPANSTILYDKSASAYAHIEDIITLGILAVQKSIAACQ